MYSLTQGTILFLEHYRLGSEQTSYDVIKYNSHKVRHSDGVLEIGRHLLLKIRENTVISPETINRAEIIFLLHDIGRFYQNDKNRILTIKEYDHGNEGCKILRKADYDEKICLAVKYHDKFDINNLYNEEIYTNMTDEDQKETLFLTKLVRDADKLQNMIFSIFSIEGFANLSSRSTSGGITPKIFSDFKNHITPNKNDLITYADEMIGMLSWLYDLNFNESFKILDFYGYFEKILSGIGKLEGVNKEEMQAIRENVEGMRHRQ